MRHTPIQGYAVLRLARFSQKSMVQTFVLWYNEQNPSRVDLRIGAAVMAAGRKACAG